MAKRSASSRSDASEGGADARLVRDLRVAARHLEKGRHEKALTLLRAAAARYPESPEALTALGLALARLGQREEAMASLRQAFTAAPAHAEALLRFARLAHWSRDVPRASEILCAMEACFLDVAEPPLATPHAAARDIARLMGAQLAMRHRLRRCLPLYREGQADVPTVGEIARALAGDRLFRFYLENFINLNAEIEYALTLVRRRWLLHGIDLAPSERLALLAALAVQCALNEYAWDEAAAESAALEALATEVAAWRPHSADGEALERLLVFALYRPVSTLANAAALRDAAAAWPGTVLPFARTALTEPLEEREIAAAILPSTPVEAVSGAVREQYEANPYPRWRHERRRETTTFSAFVREHLSGLDPPWLAKRRKSALVAGCGTGREAINYALTYSDLDVLAVDLSATSLAYAVRRGRELGVERVDFRQADILNLAELGRRFEFISAQGVLHHMAEPSAGLAVLAGLLAPGGLMRLGLYSERGRGLVVRARRHIAEAGYRPTPGDMRRFRAEALERPDDHPLRDLVVAGNDFYCLSGLRDYLFHVCEHRFRPTEIKRLLKGRGLRFLGFEIPHAGKRRLYRALFPEDPGMTDLDCWERFEETYPHMVEGLYAFWCGPV